MVAPSKSVGSRELKTRLGTYLRLVREGKTLIVTDRGRPIAELRPLSPDHVGFETRLYELAAAGVIGPEVAERRPLKAFEPIVATGGSGAEAIIEDREDRF